MSNKIKEYNDLRSMLLDMPGADIFGRDTYTEMLESENMELRKQIERARSESLDVYERVLKDAYRKIEALEVTVWHYEVIALSRHINELCNTNGWYEYYDMVETAKKSVGWEW